MSKRLKAVASQGYVIPSGKKDVQETLHLAHRASNSVVPDKKRKNLKEACRKWKFEKE